MRGWLILWLALACGWAHADSTRPKVLLDRTELGALRAEISHPGWKADLYRSARGPGIAQTGSGIRQNAEAWGKREIVIPARGGHFHNFFCEDGNRLELPPGQVFVPGPYRCPKCGKLYSGEKYEGAVRRLVHGWLAQAALDLALVAALEEAPEFGNKAKEILLNYAAAYPGPHESPLVGGMIYQSLDESMWVIPLAEAYDLVQPRCDLAERQKIEHFLRTVAAGIQRCGVNGNWGSWHLSSVGVVGYAIEDAALVAWATEKFKGQIDHDLGDDGLWPESVHTYHFFPLIAFLHFAEAARHAGVDLYRWEAKPGKSLLSMLTAPLQFAYPNLRLPAINDGWFESFLPPDLYELGYCRTHDSRFAWVLAKGYEPGVVPAGTVPSETGGSRRNGLYAFLFGGELPLHPPAPPAVSANFPVLGIAVLRSTNGAVMTFDYGPMLGHGQFDKMGITLFANETLWVADYGTPGYGSAILPYYRSTFAHNTVVVDGKSQRATKENRACVWLGNPAVEAVESTTEEAYPGVTHSRTVIRAGDVFIVRDRMTSRSEHDYDFYLHSEGQLDLDEKPPETGLIAAPVRWLKPLRAWSGRGIVRCRWREAGANLGLWLSGSAPMTICRAECPAESGTRMVPLVIARQHGKEAEFVAVLAAGESDGLEVERSGPGWRIRQGGSWRSILPPTASEGPKLLP